MPLNVTTFVASGDNGNTGAPPDYPSTSHLVVGVGGTTLRKATTERGWTEIAWSGAGSSCGNETKPAFQSVVPTAACARRAASDVSAVAGPNTGVAVFNAGSGGFIVVGGTSAASPLVAAIYARAGLAATSAHDASYAYAQSANAAYCVAVDVCLSMPHSTAPLLWVASATRLNPCSGARRDTSHAMSLTEPELDRRASRTSSKVG